MSRLTEQTDFIVRAAFCSVSIADLAFEPRNKFGLTKLGFLLSNRISNLEHALLFRNLSDVPRS